MSAGGRKLGDAYIEVRADASRVGSDLEQEIDSSARRIVDALEEIARRRVDVDVEADTTRARGELDTIRNEVDRLDGRTANVNVRVDDGGSLVRMATGIGSLLGSLGMLSAGAAGAAAIGGIGIMAVSALPAVAALGLGFSGVSEAMELNEQRTAAAATAATAGAGAQTSAASAIASAQRSLEGAEASLANTRINAAEAATRAAREVSDAQLEQQRTAEEVAAAIAGAELALADTVEANDRRMADSRRNLSDVRERTTTRDRDSVIAVAEAERRGAELVETALQRQQQAERALTDAQESQRSAQLDLTQARKDAEDQLEDLAARVEGNALDQRQSVLDVAAAEAYLAEVRKNPDATDAAIEQAEIAYARQIARQEDLKRAAERLAEDQAKAAVQGVENSDLVTAARERLKDAEEAVGGAAAAAREAGAELDAARLEAAEQYTEALADQAEVRKQNARDLADAERALADDERQSIRDLADARADLDEAREDGARRTADAERAVTDALAAQRTQLRQSQFSIEQGQASVEAAMAAVSAAAVGAGAAGVSALAGIDAELAKVDPATRRFADFLDGTAKPALDRLKATAAAGLLPGVEAGLDALLEKEPLFSTMISGFSTSLGGLFQGALERLTNPTWTTFFETLTTEGVPTMEALFHAGENVAEGLAAIWTTFAPVGTDLAQGIEGLTEKFLTWSKNLKDSEGLKSFTAYVKENWPIVKEVIGNVYDLLVNVAGAGMGIAAELLPHLLTLTDVVSSLPVGVVEALLGAFLAYKGLTAISSTITGVTDAISGLRGQATGVTNFLNGLTGSQDETERSTGRLSRGLGGITAALGGPWGLAIAGATLLVGAIADDMADATKKTDEWAQALLDGGRDVAEEYAKDREDRMGFEWMKDLDEWAGLAPSLDDARKKADELRAAMDPLQLATQRQSEWTATLRARLLDENATSAEVADAKEQLAFWSQEVANKQALVDGATQAATGALDTQKQSLDELTGSTIAVTEAESDFWASIDGAKAAVEGLSGQVVDSTGKFDLHTEAGRRGQEAMIAVRDANNELIDRMIAQGATSDEVVAKDALLRQSFIDTAIQMGFSKVDAENLANQILGIPSERKTQIDADTAAASANVGGFAGQVNGLPDGNVDIYANTGPAAQSLNDFINKNRTLILASTVEGSGTSGPGGKSFRLATGGRVVGPGTGTSDSILGRDAMTGVPTAWVSNMEYVVNAQETQKNLALIEAINAGAIPAGVDPRSLQFLAGGGQVYGSTTLSADVDTSGAQASLQALIDAMPAAGSLGNSWSTLWATILARHPKARLNSSVRNTPDAHGRGKAVDIGLQGVPGGAGNSFMASVKEDLYRNFADELYELIYSGIGGGVVPNLKNSKPFGYSKAVMDTHTNHLHAAVYDQGGWLPDGGIALNNSGVPEPVFTAEQWKTLSAALRVATTVEAGSGNLSLAASFALAQGVVQAVTQALASARELAPPSQGSYWDDRRQQFVDGAGRPGPAAMQPAGQLATAPMPAAMTAEQWTALAAGQGVHVTYAPQITVPTVPTAREAAAVLEQNLVRSLQLGLTNAELGEVTP